VLFRSVEVAPFAAALASFPVPRQGFTNDGLFRIPYRVVVSNGVPQNGEVPVVLRSQARWWVSIHKKTGPESGADSGGPDAAGLDVAPPLRDRHPAAVHAARPDHGDVRSLVHQKRGRVRRAMGLSMEMSVGS
jgi:hypothetical protein